MIPAHAKSKRTTPAAATVTPPNVETPAPTDIFAAAYEPPEAGAKGFAHAFDADPSKPAFHVEVDTAGVDLFDGSAERAMLKEADRELGVDVPDQPSRQSAPITNGGMMSDPVRQMQLKADEAFSEQFDDLVVTVTPAERDRFVRAALFDTEMTFDVVIEGLGVQFSVAIPTELFTASSPLCIDAWGKTGAINTNSTTQWLLAFQQLHVWYQVRSINDSPTAWSTMFMDGVPKLSKLIEYASEQDNLTDVREMSAPRWRLCVEAVRIAERKYKLCLEAWHDRSFFTSAGTV